MKKTGWAILKDVEGVTSKTSYTAWAGEPFKLYESASEALKECNRINKIYRENGLPYFAYVSEGLLHDVGFISYE